MHYVKTCCTTLMLACTVLPLELSINTQQDRHPISPYIYGTNSWFELDSNDLVEGDYLPGARRMGGNATEAFNWENNSCNYGKDYLGKSEWAFCLLDDPGEAVRRFHEYSLRLDSYSLITVGLNAAAADKNGTLTAPISDPRWARVVPKKGAPFTLEPDIYDSKVFVDEMVNFYVSRWGDAGADGINGYSLDNEPEYWNNQLKSLIPNKPTAKDVLDKSIAAAAAIKSVDPKADVFGPASHVQTTLLHAEWFFPDWNSLESGAGYETWFDYYLDRFAKASTSEGKRLLDVLDIHWYPSSGDRAKRPQIPRELYDPSFAAETKAAMIPYLQQRIEKYYPGTKLAITEWNVGQSTDVTGGVAAVDALGAFGQLGVYLATFWPVDETEHSKRVYYEAALKLFRNVDGGDNGFGDISVAATSPDLRKVSVYAAQSSADDTRLHIIVIDKTGQQSSHTFSISSDRTYTGGVVYGFDSGSPQVSRKGTIESISNNSFTHTVPPYGALHFILSTQGVPALAARDEVELDVTPVGLGHIRTEPPGRRFERGTTVKLIAEPFGEYVSFSHWRGDASGSGTETSVTMGADKQVEAVFTSAKPAGTELIRKGDFPDTLAFPWTFGFYNGSARASAGNGELCFDIRGAGPEPWSLTVYQTDFMLEQGKQYRLSFDAVADEERSIGWGLQMNGHPWTTYAGAGEDPPIVVTTTRQTFTFEFTMDSSTADDIKLMFTFAPSTVNWCLSNVSLKQIGSSSTASAVVLKPESQTPRATGHGSRLILAPPHGSGAVAEAFLLDGRRAGRISSGNGRSCSMSTAPIARGVYFVRVRDGKKTSTTPILLAP